MHAIIVLVRAKSGQDAFRHLAQKLGSREKHPESLQTTKLNQPGQLRTDTISKPQRGPTNEPQMVIERQFNGTTA